MAGDRPNVLLLVSDQHNYRYFSYRENGEPVRTPIFDGLAESGTVFDRTYCAVPLCTPSRLCTLTGRSAVPAGAWDNYSLLKPGLSTLAGTLSDAGYETCLQGKMHLGGDRQFAGFDHRPYGDLTGQTGHQDDPPDGEAAATKRSRITGAGVTGIPESLLQERSAIDETVAFLREQRHRAPDTPWFLCASFSRPHWPRTAPRRHVDRYDPADLPEPRTGPTDADDHPYVDRMRDRYELSEVDEADERRARAAYFACVDFLDEMLGDLLGTLERDGLLEDTVVVYVSDHGELAGEHGLWEKRSWHEGSTRVPWIVQFPEQRAGEMAPATLSTPVSLIDLFPTICGIADAPVPDDVDGVDLSRASRTGEEPDRGPVFVDYLQPEAVEEGYAYRMVVDGDEKYVRFREDPDLLFDVGEDPLEERNRLERDASADHRLRTLAAESLDFTAAAERAERDGAVEDRHQLGGPQGTGNAYYLPDGRIVDAGTTLYHPHVLAENPTVLFDDHP